MARPGSGGCEACAGATACQRSLDVTTGRSRSHGQRCAASGPKLCRPCTIARVRRRDRLSSSRGGPRLQRLPARRATGSRWTEFCPPTAYQQWNAALRTYADAETRFVFRPEQATAATAEALSAGLCKYSLGLQRRDTVIWLTLCQTLVCDYRGDVRLLLARNGNDAVRILREVCVDRRSAFPYLGGRKICPYWLYVIEKYTDCVLVNRGYLSIDHDSHIIRASNKIGLLDSNVERRRAQRMVEESWKVLLKNTELDPIDVHTPLWLWSRNNFSPAL
jgi:hypothetical protein